VLQEPEGANAGKVSDHFTLFLRSHQPPTTVTDSWIFLDSYPCHLRMFQIRHIWFRRRGRWQNSL